MDTKEIIDLYKQCGIKETSDEIEIRYVINTGNLTNKLNTSFEGLNKKEGRTNFVNSAVANFQPTS